MELAGDGRPRQQNVGLKGHRPRAQEDRPGEYFAVPVRGSGKVARGADLSKGRSYLQPDWGYISLCTWFDLKFHIKLDPAQFNADMPREQIRSVLVDEVKKLYHEKEVEFPVTVAMARFMDDKGAGGAIGQKYNREGLYHWYMLRFGQAGGLTEEQFRTESRAHLLKKLIE